MFSLVNLGVENYTLVCSKWGERNPDLEKENKDGGNLNSRALGQKKVSLQKERKNFGKNDF